MIPKIIHYIWFGDQNRKPQKRIDSWKMVLPDWEFKEWTEDTLDLNKYSYVRAAYDMKRYGICIDPFRPYLLYTYGGIWFDTDVNVYKDFSEFLDCSLLVGCHYNLGVSLGVLGSEPNHSLMKRNVEWYEERWTKSTIQFDDATATTFAAVHGSQNAPEPIFRSLMRQIYGVTPPRDTQDIKTTDGILRFKAPHILTTRLKSYPEINYAEHLYEGSWRRAP